MIKADLTILNIAADNNVFLFGKFHRDLGI